MIYKGDIMLFKWFERKPKKNLTVADYLSHISEAFAVAGMVGADVVQKALMSSENISINIGDDIIEIPEAAFIPEGYFGLDSLEIECRSGVEVEYDDKGNAIGLAMTMSDGLSKNGMHVQFKAKFKRNDSIESMEIIREGQNRLTRRLVEQNTMFKY